MCEFEIEIAFPESDEIDGSLFLEVTESDSLESLFQDIYNQVGIEIDDFDFFVGTKKSISPNL